MAQFKNKRSKITHLANTPSPLQHPRDHRCKHWCNRNASALHSGGVMINVGAFSTCVTTCGGWLTVVDGLILETRKTFDETGHLFRMCLGSAPGGEWESGRKFCQTVSKFCRVCMLMEFPADYTGFLDWVDPLKSKKESTLCHIILSATLREQNRIKTADIPSQQLDGASPDLYGLTNTLKIIYRPERLALNSHSKHNHSCFFFPLIKNLRAINQFLRHSLH